MRIESPAFAHGQHMPEPHSRFGENLSLHASVSGVEHPNDRTSVAVTAENTAILTNVFMVN